MVNVNILERNSSLMERRRSSIEKTIEFIKRNRSDIRDILTEVSTYRTAEEEIDSSIKTLEKGYDEVRRNQPPDIDRMSVFMPSNVLLYSYVLYLLIPSYYTKEIEFRSSSMVSPQAKRLHDLLKKVHELPITLLELSHRKYIKESAMKSDVVVFTGTYQNAENIKFQLSDDQLFVYFGQGVNPFILTESAYIEHSAEDLIAARMFNSGQDCMGPDAIYVHRSISDAFIHELLAKVKQLKYGSNLDLTADYGKIHYTSTLESVGQYLNQHSAFIRHGGTIDYHQKVLQPTVLVSHITDKLPIDEYFSPIFNVIIYDQDEQLKSTLQEGYFLERAMGASLYCGDGSDELLSYLQKKHVVSVNQTLFEIEDGNSPFGGYGPMANYASYRGELHIHPLLLSKVLHDLWGREG
ncbi:aldehyde dehydrogenase family protein [Bacillus sp. JRC01]|nr:aldehyde dehydrogenase family protein [Bacillus sp. JRC01]